jgi:hypothetical protein
LQIVPFYIHLNISLWRTIFYGACNIFILNCNLFDAVHFRRTKIS